MLLYSRFSVIPNLSRAKNRVGSELELNEGTYSDVASRGNSLANSVDSKSSRLQLIVDIALKRIDTLSAFLFYLVERIMISGD